MARTQREVWAKRVERWKSSELTAKEFAAEIGVNPRTLIHWKWQLGKETRAATAVKAPRQRKAERVSFAEVAITASDLVTSAIEIVVGEVVIRVGSSFDEDALRRVLAIVTVGS